MIFPDEAYSGVASLLLSPLASADVFLSFPSFWISGNALDRFLVLDRVRSGCLPQKVFLPMGFPIPPPDFSEVLADVKTALY